MKKKIAFITGATSGIGKATAEALAPHYNLILCGRREERLTELANTLDTDTYPLLFDVRELEKVEQCIHSLPEEWKAIDLLINNAGNAHGLDLIHQGSILDFDAMIDINVKGLLYVSRTIVPMMVERKTGHIINISSIAGKEVYPNGGVYCASKHAVTALSDGLRMELNPFNIKVSNVCPGAVDTEFSAVRFKGDMERASKVYEGYEPLYAKDIADIIAFMVLRPEHVNISDITILPKAQGSATIFNKK
ncbi:SDR family NAD(P)-dependent oxidoreductase [Persicobacter psychrovividus]|uniref:L-allo-threonine dehydrogenase n=1 Tax=Persicobacter psychrovividus TaxID=387638 RepID=A0ABM7VAB3_9BACT|nr:L-allo-threonine dehydrogenase [Persicobacter psychrovividus]